MIKQPWRPPPGGQLALNRELREYSALQKTDCDNDFSKSRSVVPLFAFGYARGVRLSQKGFHGTSNNILVQSKLKRRNASGSLWPCRPATVDVSHRGG